MRVVRGERAMFDSLTAQRLLALFAAGWLLFDYPLLGLWDRDGTLLGVPVFPLALFAVWGLVIVALALFAEGSGRD
jgi:hypothetical protein